MLRTATLSEDFLHGYIEQNLGRFIALSEVMLARRHLPEDAARAYFKLLLQVPPLWYEEPTEEFKTDTLAMGAVLDTFERLKPLLPRDAPDQFLARVFYSDIVMSTVVQSLLIVWYNGWVKDKIVPASAYPFALVWEAISAHPMGMPGPYFGSWSYPPPEPILPPGGASEDP
ncbi:MAG: hypothetical protein ABW123_29490 [Cystobacter sp.]